MPRYQIGPELLLRRDHLDELAELASQVAPAALHVLDQRLRLVLGENGDLADAGVHAVREHEVDDAELAAEGRRGLAAVCGEVFQTLAASAGHDDCERAAGQAAHVASGRGSRGLSGHGGLRLRCCGRYYNAGQGPAQLLSRLIGRMTIVRPGLGVPLS